MYNIEENMQMSQYGQTYFRVRLVLYQFWSERKYCDILVHNSSELLTEEYLLICIYINVFPFLELREFILDPSTRATELCFGSICIYIMERHRRCQ